jgi:hypothetical protein
MRFFNHRRHGHIIGSVYLVRRSVPLKVPLQRNDPERSTGNSAGDYFSIDQTGIRNAIGL